MNNEILNWIIDLQGGPYDLHDCATLFESGTEIRVEREHSGNSIPRYYLHSSEFKGLPDTQIHAVAATLIAKLNEALKLRGGAGSVMMGFPITIRADGSRIPMKVVVSSSRILNEHLSHVIHHDPLPYEHITSITSASPFPLEHLGFIRTDQGMPIESLRSRLFRLWTFNKYPFIVYILIQIAGLCPSIFPWNKVGFYYALVLCVLSTVVGVYAIERVTRTITTPINSDLRLVIALIKRFVKTRATGGGAQVAPAGDYGKSLRRTLRSYLARFLVR